MDKYKIIPERLLEVAVLLERLGMNEYAWGCLNILIWQTITLKIGDALGRYGEIGITMTLQDRAGRI